MPIFEITSPDGRKFRVEAPEGATREDALKRVQSSYKPPEALKADPTEGMSSTEKFLAGTGKGMTDVVRGLGQAVGLVSRADMDQVRKQDAPLMNTTAGTVGDIAGNVAATLPAMRIPGAATIKGSAAIGVGQGLLAPVATDESRLGNAAQTGVGGALGAAIPQAAARLAQPVIQSAPVQKLLKEGVVPTIGQSAGGFLNRIEQQLESIPLIGAFITSARGRAVKEMNEAAIRKALPAGSTEAIKAGRAGVERAGEVIDGAYDRAYGQLKGVYGGDKPFQNAIESIPTKEGIDLPPSLKERFDKLIQDRVYARLDKGANAETVRDIHNSLGALARKYRSSGDADQRALGQAFAEAKKEFRGSISRQTETGDFKATLDALDQKYSALLAVEKASGYSGSKEGVFSAEALNRAAKKAPAMQEFTSDAADVLGRTVPDSGTAGRMLLPLASAAAAGGNEYMGGSGFLTGALAAPLLYSRMGSRYAVGGYPAQQTLAEMIRGAAPYASQLGRSIGSQ